MNKVALTLLLLAISLAMHAQRADMSLQAGFVFNTALKDKTVNNKPLNEGLSASLQFHYRLPRNFEIGPILELGAIATMGGFTGTAGIVANKKVPIRRATGFAGVIADYIFDTERGIDTKGYTYGVHLGWDIPLGRLAALYMSAGGRYAMQETAMDEKVYLSSFRTESLTFPVLIGARVKL